MVQCAVCMQSIEPDAQGRIRFEGIAEDTVADDGKHPWAWGPFPVHEPCRVRLDKPTDEYPIGGGEYFSAWEISRPEDQPAPVSDI